MKQLLTLCFLTLTFPAISQIQKIYDSTVKAKKTGDDKKNFSSFFTAIGSFTSSDDDANITLQPTLFAIGSIFSKEITKDVNYSKNSFLKNTQLKFAFNPSDISIFKYDSIHLGFSYAIINNKKLSKTDYADFTKSKVFRDESHVTDALNAYKASHPGNAGIAERALADQIFRDGLNSERVSRLPADLQELLKIEFGVSSITDLPSTLDSTKKAFDEMVRRLAFKTSLTMDFNSIYDFNFKQWQEISFTPLNFYYFFCKSLTVPHALNLKFTYLVNQDEVTKDFSRNSMKAEAGVNFVVKAHEGKPAIEIKPAVKLTTILSTLHADEKATKTDFSSTFRFRINDDFTLPLKLLYDTKNGDFFGFLSIQFAL